MLEQMFALRHKEFLYDFSVLSRAYSRVRLLGFGVDMLADLLVRTSHKQEWSGPKASDAHVAMHSYAVLENLHQISAFWLAPPANLLATLCMQLK